MSYLSDRYQYVEVSGSHFSKLRQSITSRNEYCAIPLGLYITERIKLSKAKVVHYTDEKTAYDIVSKIILTDEKIVNYEKFMSGLVQTCCLLVSPRVFFLFFFSIMKYIFCLIIELGVKVFR